MKKYLEADMGKALVKWLETDGWDVYPEVCKSGGSRRADIIAVRKKISWAIEIKKGFGLEVIAQVLQHPTVYQSVAVLPYQNNKTHALGKQVCEDRGVGILIINNTVHEEVCPKIHRENNYFFKKYLKKYLCKEQKEFVPGSKHGYSTPYQRTIIGVKEYLKRVPGATLTNIIENCIHHYRGYGAAKSGFYAALTNYENEYIRSEKVRGKLRFYLR